MSEWFDGADKPNFSSAPSGDIDWLPALMRQQMLDWEREHGDLPVTWERPGDLSEMSVRAMASRA